MDKKYGIKAKKTSGKSRRRATKPRGSKRSGGKRQARSAR